MAYRMALVWMVLLSLHTLASQAVVLTPLAGAISWYCGYGEMLYFLEDVSSIGREYTVIHMVNLSSLTVARLGVEDSVNTCVASRDIVILFPRDASGQSGDWPWVYEVKSGELHRVSKFSYTAPIRLELTPSWHVGGYGDYLYLLRRGVNRTVIETRRFPSLDLVEIMPADGAYRLESWPGGLVIYYGNDTADVIRGELRTRVERGGRRWVIPLGDALILYDQGQLVRVEEGRLSASLELPNEVVSIDSDGKYVYVATRVNHNLYHIAIHDGDLRRVAEFYTTAKVLEDFIHYVGEGKVAFLGGYGYKIIIRVFDRERVETGNLVICFIGIPPGSLDWIVDGWSVADRRLPGCVEIRGLLEGSYKAGISYSYSYHTKDELVYISPGSTALVLILDDNIFYISLLAFVASALYLRYRRA